MFLTARPLDRREAIGQARSIQLEHGAYPLASGAIVKGSKTRRVWLRSFGSAPWIPKLDRLAQLPETTEESAVVSNRCQIGWRYQVGGASPKAHEYLDERNIAIQVNNHRGFYPWLNWGADIG